MQKCKDQSCSFCDARQPGQCNTKDITLTSLIVGKGLDKVKINAP